MTFLAPFFLAGLALLAAPILFHLIRQVPRNRVVFSSTELLEKSQPKTEKSRRIQNPWLLLIRCLIIALLAFAFARPFIPDTLGESSPDTVRRDMVIAIDQSASMSRSGIKAQVLEEARALLQGLRDGDQLTVFGFSDTITPIVSAEQWASLDEEQRQAFAIGKLEDSAATARPGALDQAISEGVAEIRNLRERTSTSSYGELAVISDFAQGTTLTGIESIDWPSDFNLRNIQVNPTLNQTNLGLRWLGWGESETGETVARIAISSTIPEQSITAKLTVLNGESGERMGDALSLLLENQSEHSFSIPIDTSLAGGRILFQLEGDSEDFDNILPVALPYIPELKIGLFSATGKSDPNDSPYFIAKGVEGFETPLTSLELANPLDLASQAYIVNRPLSLDESRTLRGEIVGGKAALLLASSTEFSDTIRRLTGDSDWSIGSGSPEQLLVGETDLSHSLFAPFADARFSNFANIRTWESLRLTVPENENYRVLARFDDDSPMLAELTLEEGHLFIWASSWAPASSQWVLSSKFIPFLHRFALLSSGGPTLPSNSTLTHENTKRYRELLPDADLSEVGFYAIPGARDRWVAFQSSPQESQTRPLSGDEWDRLDLPESGESTRAAQLARIAKSAAQESASQTEKRQQIWQWLLWSVLALLAAESLMAISIGKQKEATS